MEFKIKQYWNITHTTDWSTETFVPGDHLLDNLTDRLRFVRDVGARPLIDEQAIDLIKLVQPLNDIVFDAEAPNLNTQQWLKNMTVVFGFVFSTMPCQNSEFTRQKSNTPRGSDLSIVMTDHYIGEIMNLIGEVFWYVDDPESSTESGC